ncbi:MAG TPA: hypothetical protein VG602_04335 [Actinomycetota bacterium]|nr:hypothetical protein [Actinomycetota bacterium]
MKSGRSLKGSILVVLLGLIAWPGEVAASDHEVPEAVLHAPRGQQQEGGVSGFLWTSPTPTEPCPEGPHADVFEGPRKRPILVTPGKAMFVRFHKDDQPTTSDPSHPSAVDVSGPRGQIPYTLLPYAPEGQVIAWDARFKAPSSGRRPYNIFVQARWRDEHCQDFTQWVAWIFSVQKRRAANR